MKHPTIVPCWTWIAWLINLKIFRDSVRGQETQEYEMLDRFRVGFRSKWIRSVCPRLAAGCQLTSLPFRPLCPRGRWPRPTASAISQWLVRPAASTYISTRSTLMPQAVVASSKTTCNWMRYRVSEHMDGQRPVIWRMCGNYFFWESLLDRGIVKQCMCSCTGPAWIPRCFLCRWGSRGDSLYPGCFWA